MRSIQVNIDKPNFTINPTNCARFAVDSQGIGDQGTVTDFSSYFQAVNCATLPFKPKMTMRPDRQQGHQARQEPGLRVRPQDPPRRRQHQVALGDPVRTPSRSTSATSATSARRRSWPQTSAPAASRSARRSTTTPLLDAAAWPAPSTRSPAPAACRDWPSSSNGQVQPGPPGQIDLGRQGRPPADHRPGRPRRADRPLPPDPLRRQDRLPGQHPRASAPSRRSRRSNTPPRTAAS